MIEYKKFKIDDFAPFFEGVNQFNQNIKINELLKNEHVILVFCKSLRNKECINYLHELQEWYKIFKIKGATVVAVFPKQRESVLKKLYIDKIQFSILFDSSSQIIDAYGVSNKQSVLKKNNFNFLNRFFFKNLNNIKLSASASAATFIINQDGKFQFVCYDVNSKRRVTVTEIILLLNKFRIKSELNVYKK